MILLVGNWKMAPEKKTQVVVLTKATSVIARQYKKTITTVVCPSFVHIPVAVKAANTALCIGAQYAAPGSAVASTGLVSAAMLKDAGVQYCIVGHSENRARGETNEMVRESVARLLEKKIRPIVCIGERDRDTQGWYLSEIKDQLEGMLVAVPRNALKQLVIAYEPVWAIGSAAVREATPQECREMVIFIRKILTDTYDEKAAKIVPIIYGGSANEQNANLFIAEGKAQGLLVGRVSLDPKRFALLANTISHHE